MYWYQIMLKGTQKRFDYSNFDTCDLGHNPSSNQSQNIQWWLSPSKVAKTGLRKTECPRRFGLRQKKVSPRRQKTTTTTTCPTDFKRYKLNPQAWYFHSLFHLLNNAHISANISVTERVNVQLRASCNGLCPFKQKDWLEARAVFT